MKLRRIFSARNFALLLVCLLALNGCQRKNPSSEKADLVIRNARVYTVDAQQPWAQAVAVKGDRILWVGDEAGAAAQVGDATRVLDAGGKMVLPGFIDSHFHVLLGGNPDVLRIEHGNSLHEIQEQVRNFAQQRPQLRWIEVEGWNYSAFPHGTLPTAKDLEDLTGGRPAFLVAYDYHTIWMNREAMREFGITRKTDKVIFAEKIEKDARGEPTGILTGFGSTGLSEEAEAELRKHLPSHAAGQVDRGVQWNMSQAVKAGITTIVDPQSYPEDLEIFEKLRGQGKLPARLQVALFHRRGTPEAMLQKFDEARRKYNDDRLRVAAVKLYIDDVIEPHTAALLEPYADRPNTRGELDYPPEEFKQVVARLDRMKFQVFIHSIGDRGIRTALDAIEYAEKQNGPRDRRDELVHIECLNAKDISRFKQLGVIACMQPRHCAPDITGQWAKAVGPQRWKYAWAFRSLRDSGATLAFGSDWNVAEMEPLIGIYTALTRKGLDGKPQGGWIPEQTIDLETAIRGYTINGAYANFIEQNRGSISPGKYADLVMISDDLFKIPADKIKDVKVEWTMVGGKEVWKK
ncbi:MAG TPA: amidohydrolase [Terriglobales bacterium]|nr:amidohydrolase [Terriglobales bacterium]